MNKKLIFFDIDGTLSMPGHGVSEAVQEALEKVRENGHLLFINTGRTHKDIPEHIKELELDGGVYSAGGKVVFHDKVLSEKTLDDKELKRIRDVLDSMDINYNLEGVKKNYCVNIDEFRMPAQDISKLSTEMQRFVKAGGMTKPEPIEDYDGQPVYKVNFRVNEKEPEKIEKINQELGKEFRIDYFTNIFSDLGTVAGEITRYDINKGNGIQVLCDYLDIPIEDTIAFGDSSNDIDMIKKANLGIAMGNSSNDLIEEANLVCESCSDDGVAKTLKRLELY